MKLKFIAIALVLCFAAQAGGTRVELSKVPKNVIAAAKAQVNGIDIVAALSSTKNSGRVVYEIKGRIGNQGYELKVTAAGDVLDVEKEDAIPVKLSEIPKALKKTIAKTVPGMKIVEAGLRIKGNKKIYEIEGTLGEKEYELLIDGSGQLRKLETDDDEEDRDGEDGADGEDGRSGHGEDGADGKDGRSGHDDDGDEDEDDDDDDD